MVGHTKCSPPLPTHITVTSKKLSHRFPKDPYANTVALGHFGNGNIFRASRGEYEAHIFNCTLCLSLSLFLSFSLCVLRRRDCGKALSPSQNILYGPLNCVTVFFLLISISFDIKEIYSLQSERRFKYRIPRPLCLRTRVRRRNQKRA